MNNEETTCLLPTTAVAAAATATSTSTSSWRSGRTLAGDDDDDDADNYESSYSSAHDDSPNRLIICNTSQTEKNTNKYTYGSLVVVGARPWSSESESGDVNGKAKQTSRRSLVVKTFLLVLLSCLFLRLSSNSKEVVSEQQQQTKDFTKNQKQQLGKSSPPQQQQRQQHGSSSSSLQKKNKSKIKNVNDKNSNNSNSNNNNNHLQNVLQLLSLDDFLQERQEHPTRHFVIGNKAGDADSVVSALTLAYIESSLLYTQRNADDENENDKNNKTPIASITRADFQSQRPDISLLFQWAGISSNHVLFVDDIPSLLVLLLTTTTVVDDGTALNDETVNDGRGGVVVDVTLTDHNVMDIDMPSSSAASWSVVEIVDHHADQGQHMDTCTGDSRLVAFEQKRALVASSCSLVAERLQHVWRAIAHGSSGDNDNDNNNKGKIRRTRARTTPTTPAPPPQPYYYYPASVSLLLLGVILIDSMNLSPHANAATLRDVNAVQDLLEHTNWHDLPLETQNQLGISSTNNNNNNNDSPTMTTTKPNTTLMFNKLQDAKYNPDFWKSLSVRDALRLDYKDYQYGGDNDLDSTDTDANGQKVSSGVFGISSIRIPIEDFLANKQDLVTDIINYMVDDAHIDFLAIMPVFVDENGQYLKQLVLINRNINNNNNSGSGGGEINAASPPLPPSFFDKLKLYLLQESLGLQQIQVNCCCNQKTVGLHVENNNNNVDNSSSPNDNNGKLIDGDQSISLVFFNQLNIQPSRKQIGPILRTFFDDNSQ